jgi:hypothetical protein
MCTGPIDPDPRDSWLTQDPLERRIVTGLGLIGARNRRPPAEVQSSMRNRFAGRSRLRSLSVLIAMFALLTLSLGSALGKDSGPAAAHRESAPARGAFNLSGLGDNAGLDEDEDLAEDTDEDATDEDDQGEDEDDQGEDEDNDDQGDDEDGDHKGADEDDDQGEGEDGDHKGADEDDDDDADEDDDEDDDESADDDDDDDHDGGDDEGDDEGDD